MLQINFGYAHIVLLPQLIVLSIALTIDTLIALLLFHRELYYSLGALLLISVYASYFQSKIYYAMGAIKSKSMLWNRAWKFAPLEKDDQLLLNKYLRSCPPLVVQVGEWHHIRKITSLTVVGKIILYTSKIMLLLNNSVLGYVKY